MPRIPEGQFNKTPSTRVGSQEFTAPKATGIDRAVDAAKQITSAMAKVQDQRERTEAYNAANDVKRGYEQKKANYALALENAGADGNYSFPDPLSEDPTNPTMRSGNVNKDLDELNKYYSTSQEKLGGLQRADIASDLAQQYVGDDLNLLRMKTGKNLIRKQQKLQLDNGMKNIEAGAVQVLELSADSGTSKEVLNAHRTSFVNRVDREIALLSPSIGAGNTEKLKEYKDRILAKAAQDSLNQGFTQANMETADFFLEQLEDPMARQSGKTRLEKMKKSSARTAETTGVNRALSVAKAIDKQDYVPPAMVAQLKDSITQLENRYYDPKYSYISPEEMQKIVTPLKAKLLTTHAVQESLETVDFVVLDELMQAKEKVQVAQENGRQPSMAEQAAVNEAESKLDVFLKDSMRGLGMRDLAGGADEIELLSTAKAQLAEMYKSMPSKLPGIVAAKYPNMSKEEQYAKIEAIAEGQKLGMTKLVPSQGVSSFRKEMKEALRTNDASAINVFTEQMHGAGEKYSRAVAVDLAAGDKKLEFLVPAADLMISKNSDMAAQAIRDAQMITTQEALLDDDSKRVTATKLEKAFISKVGDDFMVGIQDDAFQSGLKSMITNRAKALIASGEETDMDDAMDEAFKWAGQEFVLRKSSNKRHFIRAVSGLSNIDLKQSEIQSILDRGAVKVSQTAPGISLEDKRQMLVDYRIIPETSAKKLGEADIGLYFRENFNLRPSTRQTNVHNLMYQNEPVSAPDGKVLEYDIQEIFDAGSDATQGRAGFGMRLGRRL